MKRAKVLYTYNASDDTQMTIYQDEIVELTDTNQGEWWCGTVGDRDGWFPASYVEIIKEPVAPPKRPIPIAIVSHPPIPKKPLPSPQPTESAEPIVQPTRPTLMGARGAAPNTSWNSGTSSGTPTIAARPAPVISVPQNDNYNGGYSMPTPTAQTASTRLPIPARPTPGVNSGTPTPTPVTSAPTNNNYYMPAPMVQPAPVKQLSIPARPTPGVTSGNPTLAFPTGQSQPISNKPLPLAPRPVPTSTSAEAMPPVTPRTQWSGDTSRAVERSPLPAPKSPLPVYTVPSTSSDYSSPVSPRSPVTPAYNTSAPTTPFTRTTTAPHGLNPSVGPSAPSYSTPYSSTAANVPNTSSSSSSANTGSSNSYNNPFAASQSSATVVQNLSEMPPTPSKVPKMENLKSGDVVRIQRRNFGLGEKPVVTVNMQTNGVTKQIFKTSKGKSPANPHWNQAYRINAPDPENQSVVIKAGASEIVFPLAQAKRTFDFPKYQYAWFKFNNSSMELKLYIQFKRI